MIARKIQAPGVEVNEIDISQYGGIDLTDSTVILLNGFSDKGDNNVTKIITSIPSFVSEYGYPTTEAERYLYNAVKQTLQYGGIPAITKMPYQNNSLSTYSACQYIIGSSSRISALTDIDNFIEILSKVCGLTIDPPSTDITATVLTSNNEFETEFESLLKDNELTGEAESSDIDLSYSEQVRIFENFINSVCDFSSFNFSNEELDAINDLLFGTFSCYRNIRDIFYTGESNSDINEKIYLIMKKNGYDNFDSFFEDLSKTITKDRFLKCLKDVEGTPYAVDTSVYEFFESLKYTDLAMINGFESVVGISADCLNTMPFETYDDCIVGVKNIPEDSIAIVDITRAKYEKDKLAENENKEKTEYLGIVPVLVSPVNALYYQNLINRTISETSCYNIVSEVSSTNGIVPQDHAEVNISSDNENDITLGSIAASYFPKIEYVSPTTLDNTMFQKIGVVVFKMSIDTSNNNLINFTPVEAFVGSLNRKNKDLITNASDYIEDIVNNQSQYINLFENVSENTMKTILSSSTIIVDNQKAFSLGFTSEDCKKDISVNLIKDSIRLAFKHLQNPNLLKIDVVADAGMSNIGQYIANTSLDNIGKYEIADNYNFPIKNSNSIKVWKEIIDIYDDFCKNVRKDCMFICDSPRNFCLVGNQKMVRRSNPSNTIENSILPSLRFMVDFNTSYGAGYCNWFRCIDDTLRYYMWMPPTIKVIEAYLRTDNQYNFWDAPAGIRRGVMSQTFDVAFNPSESDAEKLYINRWNYAVSYPLEGIILEGQKTFQKNQTAFDRVNVRRLFLRIEKDVRTMSRSFLYEPISERNLIRFNDMLNTYFQDIQTKGGILEYYVICDGRNNNATTIENNEIHCSIGIRPVKTAEFIILNFICTNQSANVEEVTSQNI